MNNYKKLIAIDLETTGFNKTNLNKNIDYNHFIIEIGAVEIVNRIITNNYFHTYLKPPRLIDEEAIKIHKINNDFLKNKPYFYNKEKDFFKFIKKSVLIIHNANFDISFLNKEMNLIYKNKKNKLENKFKIIDTLLLAQEKFPGKSNSLQSLANRFNILCNNNFHGALFDAIILAKLYLKLTTGQNSYLNLKNNILNNIKIFNNYKYKQK